MARSIEVPSSSPRAGQRFEPIQERALHKDALDAIRGLPGASRGLLVVPEFAGPIGIPDFTAYVGDIGRIRSRQYLNVPPIVNEIETGILTATHVRRASSSETIASALGWPVGAVSSRVKGLTRRRALHEVYKNRYVRPEALKPGGRLYAVEAKIEDWRSALKQVRTYRVWADSYVLVMGPLTERARTALIAEVREDRGGLVVDGHWITRPRLGQAAARRRLQAWELFAAATKSGLDDPTLALRVHS